MMTANSLTRSWRSVLCGVLSICFQSASLQAQEEGSVRVDDKTERVINRGLKYLIKYQSPDGSWQGEPRRSGTIPSPSRPMP